MISLPHEIVQLWQKFVDWLLGLPLWLSLLIVASFPTLVIRLVEFLKSHKYKGFQPTGTFPFIVPNFELEGKKELRLIAKPVEIGDPKILAGLWVENIGTAEATSIKCNILDFAGRPWRDLKWDDKPGRSYDITEVDGKSSFYFRENPDERLDPGYKLRFVFFYVHRDEAPFEISYRVLAAGNHRSEGKLLINPSSLTSF